MNTSFIYISKNLKDLGVNVFADKSGKGLNLTRLELSSNIIEVLHEDQFIDLIELSDLYLDDNNIITIGVNVFRLNTKLKNIYLHYNNIEKFDFNLKILPKLVSLILSNNNLSTLKEGVFKHFLVKANRRDNSVSRTLFIENNLFSCDCSMTWIITIQLETVVYFTENHMCTSDISGNISLSCIMRKRYTSTSCLNNKYNDCTTTKRNKPG